MTPAEKVHDLMELAMALIQLTATEIECLKMRQIKELSEIQAHKTTLSDLYHGHMAEIASNPNIFDDIDPQIRAAGV